MLAWQKILGVLSPHPCTHPFVEPRMTHSTNCWQRIEMEQMSSVQNAGVVFFSRNPHTLMILQRALSHSVTVKLLESLSNLGLLMNLLRIGIPTTCTNRWMMETVMPFFVKAGSLSPVYFHIKLRFLKGKKGWDWPRSRWAGRVLRVLRGIRLAPRGDLEMPASSSLLEIWRSSKPSWPLIVRKTSALALRRCELNKPRMEDTKPSPARSLCLWWAVGNCSTATP